MRRILAALPLLVLVLAFAYPALPSPSVPTPYRPTDHAIIAYDNKTGTQLFNMSDAHHGPECQGPEVMHTVTALRDRVYVCNGHWMTNAYSIGTGAIYVLPDHMMDWTNGTASYRFDMSTYRSSSRDWVDFDIMPPASLLMVNGQNGTSLRDGIHGSTDSSGPFNAQPGNSHFGAQVYRNWTHDTFAQTGAGPWETIGFDNSFPTAAVHRQTFEIQLSRTHIRVGMPTYNRWWVDSEISPPLTWTQGVVSLNHRSYNAGKACPDSNIQGPCGADTWHWANELFSCVTDGVLTPGCDAAFTMIHGDQEYARVGEATITFPRPAPPGSSFFVTALASTSSGRQMQVSTNGGLTYQDLPRLAQCDGCYLGDEWYKNYRLDNVPTGTQEIRLRAADGNNSWVARNFELWNFGALSSTVVPQATAVATLPPPPPTPTSEPTPEPTIVPTIEPTATPTTCYRGVYVGDEAPDPIRGEVIACP